MDDLRAALRSFRAAPIVSALAVVSLGFGTGGAVAIFSLFDALVLENLPVRDPERLVLVTSGTERTSLWASQTLWEDVRGRGIFEESFAWSLESVNASERGEKRPLEALWVSDEFFQVLGINPILGRVFAGNERDASLVLSYEYWQSGFGGGRDVLGEVLVVERVPFTVVGVAPKGFSGLEPGVGFDIVLPLSSEPLVRGDKSRRGNRFWSWLRIIGRLRAGESIEEATAALRALQPWIREQTLPPYPRADLREAYLRDPMTLVSASAGVSSVRRRYERPLVVLLALVGVVLIIASANVANLLLARATARRRELGIRAALGASRPRIVRHLLAEGALLGALSAGIGLAAGAVLSRLLVLMMSSHLEEVHLDLSLDGPVLFVAALAGLVVTTVSGAMPAFVAAGVDPSALFRGESSGWIGARRAGASLVPVVSQMALSLVLLFAAALFSRSLSALETLHLGFQPRGLVLVEVDLSRSDVEPSGRALLYETSSEALRSIPGVANAAASVAFPIGFSAATTLLEGPGAGILTEEESTVHKNVVTPSWLDTLGTRLLAGRDFDARDREGAPRVAIVNEALVRRFALGRNPIGTVLQEGFDPAQNAVTIVGVVEDAVYRTVRETPPPTLYLPVAQSPVDRLPGFKLGVRLARVPPPEDFAIRMAEALSGVDQGLTFTVRGMTDQVRATYRHERVVAVLSRALGGLAVLLSGLGLYGVTSYAVGRRRGEIALRIALGADRSRVLRAVASRSIAAVLLGLAVGSLGAYGGGRYIQSLLFGTSARAPGALVGAAALLFLVALLASWLSARRALRFDPASTLREET